jgi:Ca-activated chloride channel family protein
MTTTLIATSISSLLISMSALQANIIDDFLFRYHTQKGNEYYEQNYLESAEEEFDKAAELAEEKKGVAQFNKGTTAFEKQDYQEAQKQFEQIITENCTDQNTDICNKAHYNLGNTQYRLGEQQTEYEQKKQHWVNALTNYQQALELDQNDSLAQENAQFVQKKLQQLEQEQKQQESQENQDQDEQGEGEGESEQSNENESEEGDTGEENNEDESDGEENQQNEQNGTGQQTPQYNSGLSEEESQRLDQYMDQLEQEEQSLDDYFYRNGENTQPSSPFDRFLNDPFFGGNLFDDIFEQENENDTEKDW